MMVNLLDTSKTYSWLKAMGKGYFRIEYCLDNYYKNRRIIFANSFLERASRIRQKENIEILNNSTVTRYLTNWLIIPKKLVLGYTTTSRMVSSAKETARATYRAPIKTLSTIIISAILMNIFLSFFLKNQIDLFGWLMRAIFLLIGISGIFCSVNWPSIEDNSIFFKKIMKKK